MTATSMTMTHTLSPEQIRNVDRYKRMGKNSHQIAKATGYPQEAIRATFPTPLPQPKQPALTVAPAPKAEDRSLEARMKRIRTLREAGESNEAIAKAEGISTDRLGRIISKARQIGFDIPTRARRIDLEDAYRRMAALVNAGKTLAEIITAFPEQTEGQTKRRLIAMHTWAKQNNLHVEPVAGTKAVLVPRPKPNPNEQQQAQPPATRKPEDEPDAASDPFAPPETPKRPDSHWAWVANRCSSVYGPEAVAKTIGCETSQLQLWNHGSAVPSAKFQEGLWRVLVATIAFDQGMTGEEVEDLHDKLMASVKNRQVGWRGK